VLGPTEHSYAELQKPTSSSQHNGKLGLFTLRTLTKTQRQSPDGM